MSWVFFSISSLDWAFSCWAAFRSSSSLRISAERREIFSCTNPAFCWKFASSSCTLETSPWLSSASLFWVSSMARYSLVSSSISRSLASAAWISSCICPRFSLISNNWRSISLLSDCNAANFLLFSSFCSVARLKFIFSVFWRSIAFFSSSWIWRMSSFSKSLAVLMSSKRFLWPCRACASRAVSFCRSSISRFRPRRLLVLRKAPPVMDPPGLRDSPSSVTILKLYWYFLAREMAWSIWSTT